MARKRGSKNKKKNDELVKTVETVGKIVDKPIPNVSRGTSKDKLCKCGHNKPFHYGGPNAAQGGWCNAGGCKCQLIQL